MHKKYAHMSDEVLTTTIYNWKKLAENGSLILDVEQTSPVFLSSAEKLALLLEGSKKDETDMGYVQSNV